MVAPNRSIESIHTLFINLMSTLRLCFVLFSWLVLWTFPVVAQDERAYQTYLELGQRLEKQGHYQKALEAYHKAHTYAPAAQRPAIDRTISHVDEQLQKQTLLNQAQAEQIRRDIATLSSTQNRKRLQDDLAALQQRDNATLVDYQSLTRRVTAAKKVEAELGETNSVVITPPKPARQNTAPPRRPPKSTASPATGPPPKTITSSLPSKRDNKTTKSGASFVPNATKKQ